MDHNLKFSSVLNLAKSQILFHTPQKIVTQLYNSYYLFKYILCNFFALRIRSDLEYSMAKDISEYISKNDIKNKLTLLTKNIDEESKELIRLILDRNSYIYTHNLILGK